MKDNKRKLDDLVVEVMGQMKKRKYGEKISSHYRSSFSSLKSISEDIGEEYLSEKLIESFLDSPVGCSEKWGKKERTHRLRCIRLLKSLEQDGSIDWGRQKPESLSGAIIINVFRMDLERFIRQMEDRELRPNTMYGYKRIVTYFLIFCQESGYTSLSDVKANDVTRFILSLYNDGRFRPTTIGSVLSGFREFLSANESTERFSMEIPVHLPRETKIIEVYSSEELDAIEKLLSSGIMTRRDTAICRLLLETGLRGTDVCSLELKNIDWEKDAIYIEQDKTKRMLTVPLKASYGNAIVDYIMEERPKIEDTHVFLRSFAPFKKLEAGAVWPILQKMENMAGIQKKGRVSGSRMTRHNAASCMLRAGVPMSDISAVLGHKDPNIVSVYLSTDASSLAACTLPLPAIRKGGDPNAE